MVELGGKCRVQRRLERIDRGRIGRLSEDGFVQLFFCLAYARARIPGPPCLFHDLAQLLPLRIAEVELVHHREQVRSTRPAGTGSPRSASAPLWSRPEPATRSLALRNRWYRPERRDKRGHRKNPSCHT